ncbi:hypothetical protein [Lentibacillus salicampi]|uniref:hypothetical protein n=1 Tax=Lentibacillus salicampi TaxID=175306 RepID=UPI00142FE084|nr:hypothetical protein [Lentibacillus salicampi]
MNSEDLGLKFEDEEGISPDSKQNPGGCGGCSGCACGCACCCSNDDDDDDG